MNSEIKLIALDLDGTLLNAKKEVSKENIAAIKKAREKGVHVVITTGRPLLAIHHLLEELDMTGFDDFSITFNGGLIQRNTGEIVSKKTFSLDEARDIKEMTASLGLPCDLLSEGTVYMTPSALTSLYPSLNKLLHFVPKDLSELGDDVIINKVVSCTEAAILDAKIPDFPKAFYDKYEIFKSQAKLVEFMPKGINKAYGLSKLIEILDLKPENVMAMGDEENDMAMIEWAGYGVAMGNAVDKLKAAAQIIADRTNEESAVAHVIEQYVL
ncbi:MULTISPECIES: Cof-type HAD-IIB family hydrolase [unclassified Lactococcus]|uniref:Cof-type HAD-IIB family hydrolase n=1 Tax=unclassified Lactococcus TaxID=2643510 RepID=UPI0011C84605|nr:MULTISPECIES: Cof-type HAD-IIB family hydrolase [unclassified Lactococcus]MQW22636.1 Cof-type HAD-IIB family hydrolase [Lactococcus sp. dk101]TXK45654.1 HAD family phosphatase [Lactococcus sp. dk310]TXK51506.1 HAD family phosphatase [Lactococcus sp. dk322]